jgi:tetratricopeptide (TPR) repeat protein
METKKSQNLTATKEAETQLANAITQGTQGKFVFMRQGALDALGLYREVGNGFGERRALEVLGFAEGLLGNLDEKLSVLGNLVNLARGGGDNFHLARAKTEIGNVYLTRHQTNLAEQSLREVGEILPKLIGDEKRWVEWWYESYCGKLAIAKFEESRDRRFLDHARENILRMGETTDKNSPAEMAHLSMMRGFVEGMGGNLEVAQTEFENAKRLFQQVGHRFGVGEVDYFHAHVLLNEGSSAEGLRVLNLAEQEFEELGENVGLLMVDELRERFA